MYPTMATIKYIVSSILITFLFVLINTSDASQTGRLSKYLSDVGLYSRSYEQIHRLAIQDQVQDRIPAQKSLKSRATKSLNGLYDFCLDELDRGFDDKWFSSHLASKCNPGNFYRMPVPSAFNEITSNASVKNFVGWLWYQQTFSLNINGPKDIDTKQWFVQFESVNYMAIVWLHSLNNDNIYLLGSHVGGYLPFIVNLTEAMINLGQARTRNFRLTIAVSNKLTENTIPSASIRNLTDVVGHKLEIQQPDFDFFHYAGILGDVNLITLNRIHLSLVDYSGVAILSGEDRPHRFNVCLSSTNELSNGIRRQRLVGSGKLMLRVSIRDHWNSLVSAQTWSFLDRCIDLILDKAPFSDLWTPANGNANHFAKLYEVKFELVQTRGNAQLLESCQPNRQGITMGEFMARDDESETCNQRILDTVEMKLGQRSLANLLKYESTTNDTNQKNHYKLRGFGMHQEQLFSGRTMSRAAIMKDIYLLKQIGANVIRTSHYPYSTEYLDACDENGIMVIAECQAVGLKSFSDIKLALHKQLLLEMMQRDNHHPSIIVWSLANEPASQMAEAKDYFRDLVKYAVSELSIYNYGALRPLSVAIAQSYEDDLIGEFFDVIMINRYYAWYEYTGVVEAIRPALTRDLQGWAKKYANTPLILSEFGVDTIGGLHQNNAGLYSEEFQSEVLAEYEQTLEDIAWNSTKNGVTLWGSMIWNFADFCTDVSMYRIGNMNRKGIFSQNREPKQSVSLVREYYRKTRS